MHRVKLAMAGGATASMSSYHKECSDTFQREEEASMFVNVVDFFSSIPFL